MMARARFTNGTETIEMNVYFEIPEWAYPGQQPSQLMKFSWASAYANADAKHFLGESAWAELVMVDGVPYAY